MTLTQIRLSEQALDLSLTTAKIANLAVTTGKIADAAVTTVKIADANVTTAKIAGGAVTIDKLNDFRPTAGAGLVLNIASGSVRLDNVISTYAGGTLTLTASSTNYVEVNSSGTVSFNTSGFTAGRYPIATVTTGMSAITLVTDNRSIVDLDADSAVNFITREDASGDGLALDGMDTTFTLANVPVVGSEQVYLNGVLQQSGGADYTISGALITMTDAPVSTDRVLVSYRY